MGRRYVAGWQDGKAELEVFDSLEAVADAHPDVFGELGGTWPPPVKVNELAFVEAAEQASDSAYHPFVFRLAWEWEGDENEESE